MSVTFQEILGEAQVKISKQLASIKQLGLVGAKREGAWMIYHIKTPIPGLLFSNLSYLRQSKSAISAQLHSDLHARTQLLERVSQTLDIAQIRSMTGFIALVDTSTLLWKSPKFLFYVLETPVVVIWQKPFFALPQVI